MQVAILSADIQVLSYERAAKWLYLSRPRIARSWDAFVRIRTAVLLGMMGII
jgi:hypothetical protein